MGPGTQIALPIEIAVSKEIDGLEMGVLSDGTPYLSGRSLARLCGVATSTIINQAEQWAQVKMLLDYLETVGLLERDGQLFRAAKQDRAAQEASPPKPVEVPIAAAVIASSSMTATPTANSSGGGIQFSFSLNLTVAEITAMPPEQMSAFFQGVATIMAAKKAMEKK